MDENAGVVTIAPDVLLDIVRLTALATPSVAGLAVDQPNRFSRMFSGKASEGIRVEIEDNNVSVDLYVIVTPDVQMLPLGQSLQREIIRAIQDVVGMPVNQVNVHIEDVAEPTLIEME